MPSEHDSSIAGVGAIIPLGGDSLFALSHGYAVDGRVSWHPPHARGFAPMNCYLFLCGHRALLVDTGLTVHREALMRQLHALLPEDVELSLLSLRLGEFDSLCNFLPIVETFGIDRFYGVLGNGGQWADFLPPGSLASGSLLQERLATMRAEPMGRARTIEFGRNGSRDLHAFFAPLHLISSYWVYDPATKVLLTNDVFSHVLAPSADGPWVVGEDWPADQDALVEHLLDTRFWWLAGARTDDIRQGLADVFERFEVEVLAPAYGCILRGAGAVERHFDALDAVLAECSHIPAAR